MKTGRKNQQENNMSAKICKWTCISEPNGERVYETACGDTHIFIAGGPAENKHAYCPYCGKLIACVPYSEQVNEFTLLRDMETAARNKI